MSQSMEAWCGIRVVFRTMRFESGLEDTNIRHKCIFKGQLHKWEFFSLVFVFR